MMEDMGIGIVKQGFHLSLIENLNIVTKRNLDKIVTLVKERLELDGAIEFSPSGDPFLQMELVRGAAQASSDSEQELFARVIAGEMQAPGNTSKRLVDTIVAMDQKEAEMFWKISPFIVQNGLYGREVLPSVPISEPGRKRLHEAGLLDDPRRPLAGTMFPKILPRRGICIGDFHFVNLSTNIVEMIHVEHDSLSQIGRQLYSVLDVHQDSLVVEEMMAFFDRKGLTLVDPGKFRCRHVEDINDPGIVTIACSSVANPIPADQQQEEA